LRNTFRFEYEGLQGPDCASTAVPIRESPASSRRARRPITGRRTTGRGSRREALRHRGPRGRRHSRRHRPQKRAIVKRRRPTPTSAFTMSRHAGPPGACAYDGRHDIKATRRHGRCSRPAVDPAETRKPRFDGAVSTATGILAAARRGDGDMGASSASPHCDRRL